MQEILELWSVHAYARRTRLRALYRITQLAPEKSMSEMESSLNKLLRAQGVESLTALANEIGDLADGDVVFADFALQTGLDAYQQMFRLDEISVRLFALVAQLSLDAHLEELIDSHSAIMPRTWSQTRKVCAFALNIPERSLAKVLGLRSLLARSQLLRIERRHNYSFEDRFELHETALEYFCAPERDITSVTDRYFNVAPQASLSLQHYAHLDLERVLMALSSSKRIGSQVLLYGPPGTGKTELCASLAQHLNMRLFSVPTEDSNHEPIEHQARLQAFAEAQRVLAPRSDALLLFDEVEDVIRASGSGRNKQERPISFKGWLHEQLERAPVPAIWVSNSIACFDPAQLRRFACILEVPVPGLAVRRNMVSQILAPLQLSDAQLQGISARADIAPADLSAAMREVTRCQDPALALTAALNARLIASERQRLRNHAPAPSYRFDWINVNIELCQLQRFVQAEPHARILLHGPPGTGKTAFAITLAQTLDRPLMDRSASDLLSPWLGQSEINLAACFSDAERDQSVLFLDEVDSLLRSRKNAERSYEVTQVNELLKQLERFEGVFIAASNAINSIDPAALRRFDFVVKFDWPSFIQRRAMVHGFFQQWQLPRVLSDVELDHEIKRLHVLTPGDLAALARRVRAFADQVNDQCVLAWLREACALKPEGKLSAIGFVRAA